jgi:hypothetical protein
VCRATGAPRPGAQKHSRSLPDFTKAAEYGLNLSPYDFYRYAYPFPEESLANLAAAG